MKEAHQRDLIDTKINAIEAEIKRLGRWQPEPLPASAFENMGAFGMNTMAPEQWIQFVLIPRVRQILANEGDFPKGSQVGVWATRNFDGDDRSGALCTLLAEFDALFNNP